MDTLTNTQAFSTLALQTRRAVGAVVGRPLELAAIHPRPPALRIFDDTLDGPAASQSGVTQLTAGRHQIRVRLQDRNQGGRRLYLSWTPPGGARELVPGRVLYPPQPEVSQ